MKHFKLTTDFIENIFGTKLFRIELTIDCKWGKAGDKGGFLEKEKNLSGNAWVYGDAWVSGDALVSGNAQVSGNARVYGNAQVYGDAQVSGNARVYGDAWVSGDARVSGDALVYGDAWVYGNARVSGDARVYGDARVSGDARVYGDAHEKSPIQIQGSKHFVNYCGNGKIKIGCKIDTFDWWKENYVSVGKENKYTDAEIKEYGMYIDVIAACKRIKEGER